MQLLSVVCPCCIFVPIACKYLHLVRKYLHFAKFNKVRHLEFVKGKSWVYHEAPCTAAISCKHFAMIDIVVLKLQNVLIFYRSCVKVLFMGSKFQAKSLASLGFAAPRHTLQKNHISKRHPFKHSTNTWNNMKHCAI